jgi:cell wall-associated NlpC family hydrolase
MDKKSIIKYCPLLIALPCIIIAISSCVSSSRSVRSSPWEEAFDAPNSGDHGESPRGPENKLKHIANSYLGVRYKAGGMSRSGFDCSGFVVVVFKEVYGVTLPRSTGKLKWIGRSVSKRDARLGDLVFFKGGAFNSVNHVGVYMGNNAFVHASTSKGVRYDKLDDAYYTKHFAMIRRVFL